MRAKQFSIDASVGSPLPPNARVERCLTSMIVRGTRKVSSMNFVHPVLLAPWSFSNSHVSFCNRTSSSFVNKDLS